MQLLKQKLQTGTTAHSMDDGDVNASSVEEKLLEVAEGLRSVAIERRFESETCRPMYFRKSSLRDPSTAPASCTRLWIEYGTTAVPTFEMMRREFEQCPDRDERLTQIRR